MGIKQFNATYSKQEDRITFRFNTDEDQEFVFWFTRFITKGIINAVDQLIQKNFEKKHNAQIAEVIKEFQREGVEKNTKLDDSYLGATHYPLGKDPVLVSSINFQLNGNIFSINFVLTDNKNLNINLPIEATEKITFLLRRLAELAQWAITDISITPQEGGQVSSLEVSGKGFIH
jgi:hypothetical protein